MKYHHNSVTIHLKKAKFFTLIGGRRGSQNYICFILLFFTLSVGGEGGKFHSFYSFSILMSSISSSFHLLFWDPKMKLLLSFTSCIMERSKRVTNVLDWILHFLLKQPTVAGQASRYSFPNCTDGQWPWRRFVHQSSGVPTPTTPTGLFKLNHWLEYTITSMNKMDLL